RDDASLAFERLITVAREPTLAVLDSRQGRSGAVIVVALDEEILVESKEKSRLLGVAREPRNELLNCIYVNGVWRVCTESKVAYLIVDVIIGIAHCFLERLLLQVPTLRVGILKREPASSHDRV